MKKGELIRMWNEQNESKNAGILREQQAFLDLPQIIPKTESNFLNFDAVNVKEKHNNIYISDTHKQFTHLAALARMNAIMEAGCFVATHTTQHICAVEFWNW